MKATLLSCICIMGRKVVVNMWLRGKNHFTEVIPLSNLSETVYCVR